LFKITLISSIHQFRTYLTTLTDSSLLLALIETCYEKKYSKEKIYLKDTEQKTDNPEFSATNNNSPSFSILVLPILKLKSKRKETEFLLKSQEIVKSSTLKNLKKKIKSFNKKSIKQNFKIKS